MSSACHSCQTLMKLEFYRQIFTKFSNIKFYENPNIGSGIVPCGRMDIWTDRHDEANSCFSQYCTFFFFSSCRL